MAGTVFRRWGWLLIVTVLCAGVLVAGTGRGGAHQAFAANDPTDDTITVSGVGEASGVPDTLSVNFTVRVTRATVQAALDAQSRFANALLASLRHSGVKDADVQTTDVELFRTHNRKTHVNGYVSTESVQARVSPLDSAGQTISDAVASSSHVNLDGVTFDIADDAALMKQARDNAFADALDRAGQYAGLSSRSLGRVEHITETVDNGEPQVFAGATSAGGSASAPVPIAAGQQTLTVDVTVVWQLS